VSKLQALLFAFVSVAFLVGVSISIAHRSLAMALLSFFLFIATTGVGFIYKARLRRKSEKQTGDETNG
jgi:NADH:ubiquinone oxidoreductase subunit 3 (subunit A)